MVSFSLKEFIFPSEEIKKAVEDLTIYYQFCNQDQVELYKKYSTKDSFKGTFGDFLKLEKMEDLMDVTFGKPWDFLSKSIFLMENVDDDVSIKSLKNMKPEDKLQVVEIISNGQAAYEQIKNWLEPINNEKVFQAIKDSVDITIGNDKYSRLEILKFADIKTKSNKDDGIGIFPQLLEIDNPAALAEYLRYKQEPMPESLILTFMRNEKYEFKTNIYMFLVFDNNLYIIDMTEHRLNIDNSAGARSPSKYFERNYENIWLPWDVFSRKGVKSESTQLTVRDKKIFVRQNLQEIFVKSPEIAAWLDMIIYRILDYVKKNKKKIPQGVTTDSILKMLEDKSENQKIELRVKIEDKDNPNASFESRNDNSSYLLEKYGDRLKAIVPSSLKYPAVVGTQKYVENVIKYKQRVELAKILEKEIKLDFRKNHKRVYGWFKKFIRSCERKKLIETALLDKKYSILVPDDNHMFIEGKSAKVKEPTIMQDRILTVQTLKEHSAYWADTPLEIILTGTQHLFLDGRKRELCQYCKKFQWQFLVELYFRDYRQIMEFFNLEQKDLPKEYIDHFHYKNEVYYGNSILDDTDPLDSIHDPYFREKVNYGWHVIVNGYSQGFPHLEVVIPVCKICFKKCGGKLD